MDDSLKNIIITDSQFLIVEGLKSVLEDSGRFIVSGVAYSQRDLITLLEKQDCNLLITDISVPGLESINDLEKLVEKFPRPAVLLVLNSVSLHELKEASRIGIKNIILKTAGKEEILNAANSALQGKKYYESTILEMIIDTREPKFSDEDISKLTNSEIEIIKLIAEGLTTKEIASGRNISFHTVNTHRKNIFRKLGVTNTSELIIKAIKAGWIDNIEYYI